MDQFGQGLGHRFQLSLPGGRLVGDFSLPSGSRGLEGMLATLHLQSTPNQLEEAEHSYRIGVATTARE